MVGFVIALAKESDPVKGGALLRRGFGVLNESMRRETRRLHPNLAPDWPLRAYETYFDEWYNEHDHEVQVRRDEVEAEVLRHGDHLLSLTEHLVGESWPSLTIRARISALPPNAAWAGTSNIDLYLREPDPLPILLHELMHIHIEHTEFGSSLLSLQSPRRRIAMEVLTDLLLARLPDELAQKARVEYPDVLFYRQKLGSIATDVPAAELTKTIIATLDS